MKISLAELKNKKWRRWRRIGGVVAIVYGVLSGALFIAMQQPPMQFARLMARLPMVSMMILPFEPLWNIARSGDLRVGDPAPDFRLKSYGKPSWVQLSSFRGDRPVVLIFGSYT